MKSSRKQPNVAAEPRPEAVIPAKAGTHLALMQEAPMDSHLRGNDTKEEYVSLQLIGRLLLITKPIWS